MFLIVYETHYMYRYLPNSFIVHALIYYCFYFLRCLTTMPDDQAWHSLSESGLFPHLNNYQDLNPGIIGTLLAQQEW